MQQLRSWDDSGLPVTQTNNPTGACRRLLGRIMRLIWEGTAAAEGYRRRHFASHRRWLWFGQVKPLKQPGGGAAQETRDSFHVGSQTDRQTQLFSFDYVKVSTCFVSWRAKSKHTRMLFFHLWTCFMKPNKLLLEQHRAQNCNDGKLEDFNLKIWLALLVKHPSKVLDKQGLCPGNSSASFWWPHKPNWAAFSH